MTTNHHLHINPIIYSHQVCLFFCLTHLHDLTIKSYNDSSYTVKLITEDEIMPDMNSILSKVINESEKEIERIVKTIESTQMLLISPTKLFVSLVDGHKLSNIEYDKIKLRILFGLMKTSALEKSMPSELLRPILFPTLFSVLSHFSFAEFEFLRKEFLNCLNDPKYLKGLIIIQEFKKNFIRPFVNQVTLDELSKYRIESYTSFKAACNDGEFPLKL